MGHLVALVLILENLDLNLSLNLDWICICNLLALLCCQTATLRAGCNTRIYATPLPCRRRLTSTPVIRTTSGVGHHFPTLPDPARPQACH